MADPLDPTDTARDTSRRRLSLDRPGRDDVPAILVKVLFLGVVIGTAIALTPAMVGEESWLFLVVTWVVDARPRGDVRHRARAAGQVPRARHADARALRGLPDRADREDVLHQLRRRHPQRQADDGRPDRRLLGHPRRRLAAVQPHHRHRRRPDLRAVHLLPDPPGRSRDRLRGHRRRPGGGPRRGHRRERPGHARSTATRCSTSSRSARPPTQLDEIAVPTESDTFIVRDGTSEAFEGAPTLVYDEDADTITDSAERHRLHGAAEGRPGVLRRRHRHSGSPTSRGRPTSAPTTSRRSSPTAASAAASSGSSSGRSSSRPCRSSARSCSGCSSPSRSTTRGCAASGSTARC